MKRGDPGWEERIADIATMSELEADMRVLLLSLVKACDCGNIATRLLAWSDRKVQCCDRCEVSVRYAAAHDSSSDATMEPYDESFSLPALPPVVEKYWPRFRFLNVSEALFGWLWTPGQNLTDNEAHYNLLIENDEANHDVYIEQARAWWRSLPDEVRDPIEKKLGRKILLSDEEARP